MKKTNKQKKQNNEQQHLKPISKSGTGVIKRCVKRSSCSQQ